MELMSLQLTIYPKYETTQHHQDSNYPREANLLQMEGENDRQALLPSGCSILLAPLPTLRTAYFFFLELGPKLWTNQLPQLQLLGDSCSKKST